MTNALRSIARLLTLGASLCMASVALAASPAPPADSLTFEQHVRPILKAHCFHCHGEGNEIESGFDARLARLMLKGGDSGPAIVAGKHAESLIFQRISAGEMPPEGKKPSPAEISTIARWIDQGARTRAAEPDDIAKLSEITDEERDFWSFQPVTRPDVPKPREAAKARTPIDALLLQKLEAQGLTFSPEADRLTLIRRATFDLWGLPPAPRDVEQFLADSSPDAYEKLLDRLLASPHYGERWGRHWLDVAGYADSDGYGEKDVERKFAYKYRDYVISAFNDDKPFDEFIREQLAGDELIEYPAKPLAPPQADKLVATGFLRMGPDGTAEAGVDQNVARNDVVAESIKIVSTSLLGLTVGCAQCHTHRYDPITIRDYYSFRAIFEPAYNWKQWRASAARLVSLWTDSDRKKAAEVDAELKRITDERVAKLNEKVREHFEKQLEMLPEEVRAEVRAAYETPVAKRTPNQKKLLIEYPSVNVTTGSVYLYDRKGIADFNKHYDDLLAATKAKRPPEDYVHALTEVPGQLPPSQVFFRGDFNQPREAVEPSELAVLKRADEPLIPVKNAQLKTTGRRLAYARQLTDGQHPLVARVLTNRFWMHHFDRGLVSTPGDFGRLGEAPSHPELLDWLAADFVDNGWKLKRLHRLIMTSTAYRQSSRAVAVAEAKDPENRLLWRMNVRRLEAEVVRDAILAISGQLNGKMFGPPVPVMPDEVGQIVVGIDNRDSAGRPSGKLTDLGAEANRRSVYVQVRRSLPLSMLEAFDAPSLAPNCELRAESTVAPQSLLLMNNEFVVRQAGEFASRIEKEAGSDPAAQARLAWAWAFARKPSDAEAAGAAKFIADQTRLLAASAKPAAKDAQAPPKPEHLALANFCQALLCANEFLYID